MKYEKFYITIIIALTIAFCSIGAICTTKIHSLQNQLKIEKDSFEQLVLLNDIEAEQYRENLDMYKKALDESHTVIEQQNSTLLDELGEEAYNNYKQYQKLQFNNYSNKYFWDVNDCKKQELINRLQKEIVDYYVNSEDTYKSKEFCFEIIKKLNEL